MARQREPAGLPSSALGTGSSLGALMQAPVTVASLAWRIGMTAPALSPRWGRFKMVDDWRRKQDDVPTRPEAIRRLVELGLKAKGK